MFTTILLIASGVMTGLGCGVAIGRTIGQRPKDSQKPKESPPPKEKEPPPPKKPPVIWKPGDRVLVTLGDGPTKTIGTLIGFTHEPKEKKNKAVLQFLQLPGDSEANDGKIWHIPVDALTRPPEEPGPGYRDAAPPPPDELAEKRKKKDRPS